MAFIKTSSLKNQIALQDLQLKSPSMSVPDSLNALNLPSMSDIKSMASDLGDRVVRETSQLGRWIHANPKSTLGGVAAALALSKVLQRR